MKESKDEAKELRMWAKEEQKGEEETNDTPLMEKRKIEMKVVNFFICLFYF